MAEAGKSGWCRKQGIYPAELDKWCSSASAALAEPQKARASPQVTRHDRKRIKELDARTAAQGHSAGARLHLACNTTGIDPPHPAPCSAMRALSRVMADRRRCDPYPVMP